MLKLAEQRPDECIILKHPDANHGHIYCKFPLKWARVQPPREIHLSEEEREIRRRNMENLHRRRERSDNGNPV